MDINTTRFGTISLAENRIINFPYGIVGFENNTRFVIIDLLEKSAMKWLQSATDPALAFVVCDPWYFFKDYDPKIIDEDLKELKIDKKDQITVLSIVSVPSDISKTSLNLLSPIIVNTSKLIGKQIILYNSSYSTRHYIFNVIKINSDNFSAPDNNSVDTEKTAAKI